MGQGSPVVVGVDGCPGGWVSWRLGADGSARGEVFADAAGLWSACADAAVILIDIPIGLCGEGESGRACDTEARRVLGAARSRVFPTPSRAALSMPSYERANAFAKERTGKGISKQLWMIAPKIREVDRLLAADPRARGVVRECHPEVCCWGFSGAAVLASKKSDEGANERVAILERVRPGTARAILAALPELRCASASRDDVIDAMAAAVTAAALLTGGALRTLPAEAPRDERGLAMEMVYRSA